MLPSTLGHTRASSTNAAPAAAASSRARVRRAASSAIAFSSRAIRRAWWVFVPLAPHELRTCRTERRTVTRYIVQSMSDHCRPHISPRRQPVSMAKSRIGARSGEAVDAAFASKSCACSGVGTWSSGVLELATVANLAGLRVIQPPSLGLVEGGAQNTVGPTSRRGAQRRSLCGRRDRACLRRPRPPAWPAPPLPPESPSPSRPRRVEGTGDLPARDRVVRSKLVMPRRALPYRPCPSVPALVGGSINARHHVHRFVRGGSSRAKLGQGCIPEVVK